MEGSLQVRWFPNAGLLGHFWLEIELEGKQYMVISVPNSLVSCPS